MYQAGFPNRRLDRAHHAIITLAIRNAPVDAISTFSSAAPFTPARQAPVLDRFRPSPVLPRRCEPSYWRAPPPPLSPVAVPAAGSARDACRDGRVHVL